jgi:ATP-dependent exoDNAse (exonuclease V) beta subunit
VRDGDFRAYRKKGKSGAAAKRASLANADGDRLCAEAERHYVACCGAWTALATNCASAALVDLVNEIRPVLDRFRNYKRSTAVLDFDDLIYAACDLLTSRQDVRMALATRYVHVSVDEFQDTDPLQAEIFRRLCGDPPAAKPKAVWTEFAIRLGALFLVGDPKQAIYRFRGADVHAYIRARDAIRAQGPNSVLSISTNFRSCRSILAYVNGRFDTVLSSAGL